ncbi:MAG: cache domain-containing protein [Oligoflexales bacterium]|nr:cache domain-containing protein [Oligoflexales bacterium]
MKNFISLNGLFGLVTLLAAVTLEAGPSKASMGECVVKVKEVVDLIKLKGNDEAIKQINEGKFSWKDSYVFIINTDGVTMGHPERKDHIGKNQIDLKDSNGLFFIKKFIEVAREKNEGWVTYMWPKPGEKTPSKKSTFVKKAGNLIVGAGIYTE